jgi:hypothetical protein
MYSPWALYTGPGGIYPPPVVSRSGWYVSCHPPKHGPIFHTPLHELKLKLIQTHMAQKPLPWVEVGAPLHFDIPAPVSLRFFTQRKYL